jgi:RNA polymerase sigma-70 factor (ECF subfamily)
MAPDRSGHKDSARKAIEALARAETGRLLGALLRDVRDFQLAEDCLQEALESALVHWSRNGLPGSTAGWVLQSGAPQGHRPVPAGAQFRPQGGRVRPADRA